MFIFNKTEIEGVFIIEPKVFGDERGFFMETYKQSDFEQAGLKYNFIQDNQSRSHKGVLRGLHYQKNFPQAKLVRVIQGEVFDVAVDLRKNSPTYGKWVGVLLSAENKKMINEAAKTYPNSASGASGGSTLPSYSTLSEVITLLSLS